MIHRQKGVSRAKALLRFIDLSLLILYPSHGCRRCCVGVLPTFGP